MRRFIFVAALLAVVAIMAPAPADTEHNGCSATTGATVSPLIGETAPTCTFELTCTGQTAGCVYVFTLDVNGTGLVEGTMTAELASNTGSATVGFVHSDGSAAPDPSCSGAFQCHTASTPENDVLLGIFGAGTNGASALVTCSGGGLAVVQTVSCNVAAVEFGPL